MSYNINKTNEGREQPLFQVLAMVNFECILCTVQQLLNMIFYRSLISFMTEVHEPRRIRYR